MAKKDRDQIDAATRILVLSGKEDMLKRARLGELREALAEAHGDIQTHTFDGEEATLADVLDELRGYSLMMTHKVVILDQADLFVKDHREALERYAQAPVDHATLVLRAKTWSQQSNLDKYIRKVGAIVKCEALTPGEAAAWLSKRAKNEYGAKLAPGAARLLVQQRGTDLLALDSELAKLSLMVGEGEAIDAAAIEREVGESSEEKPWAVQEALLRAIARGRRGEAMEAVHEMVDQAGYPEVLVTYFVADLMRKLALAQRMRQSGAPDAVIAKAMKLWGPRVKPFLTVLNALNPGDADRWLTRVLSLDARTKSGLGEAMRNLECFCMELSDNA